MVTQQAVETVKTIFENTKTEFFPIKGNLIDKIWQDQPEQSKNTIFIHELRYCGKVAYEKILHLGLKIIEEFGCESILTGNLDEIAWLLNLRGSDIDYTPLFYSYLILKYNKETFNRILNK